MVKDVFGSETVLKFYDKNGKVTLEGINCNRAHPGGLFDIKLVAH